MAKKRKTPARVAAALARRASSAAATFADRRTRRDRSRSDRERNAVRDQQR